MAYIDTYAAAVTADSVLYKQTCVALHKAAVAILTESAQTARHAERLTWARRVVRDPTVDAKAVQWAMLQNATIGNAPTTTPDATVQAYVDSAVNVLLEL